jgi:hypothetical protein
VESVNAAVVIEMTFRAGQCAAENRSTVLVMEIVLVLRNGFIFLMKTRPSWWLRQSDTDPHFQAHR